MLTYVYTRPPVMEKMLRGAGTVCVHFKVKGWLYLHVFYTSYNITATSHMNDE